MQPSQRRLSPVVDIDRTLRKHLSSVLVTLTPVRAFWPLYSIKRSSVLEEQDAPNRKVAMFDEAGKCKGVRGGESSGPDVTDASEGVPRSLITSGGFSVLESIAPRKLKKELAVTTKL